MTWAEQIRKRIEKFSFFLGIEVDEWDSLIMDEKEMQEEINKFLQNEIKKNGIKLKDYTIEGEKWLELPTGDMYGELDSEEHPFAIHFKVTNLSINR